MSESAKELEPFKDASYRKRMWVIRQESIHPLNTIRAYTTILQKIDIAKTQGLPENFHEMLDHIAEAEHRLAIVINMMATYKDEES